MFYTQTVALRGERKKEKKAVAEQFFCKEMKKPAADSTQNGM